MTAVREVTVVVRVVTVTSELTVAVREVTLVVKEATVAVRKVMAVTRLLEVVVREVNTTLRVIIAVLEDVKEAAEVRCDSGGLLSPTLPPQPLSLCHLSVSSPGGSHTPQPHPPTPTPRPKTCRYNRCQRPCYVERDGRVHDFCGRAHADQYRAEQNRSSRAAWSHHTEDEPQGLFGWMAGACVLCISTMLMY